MEKQIQSYITELNNGNVTVETKDGKFELEDVEFDKISNMRKRCKGEETQGLIALSIVTKNEEAVTFGERDVGKFKSSTIMRLLQGLEVLYGIEDVSELFSNGENE